MTYSCDSSLSFLSFPSHLSFNLEGGLLVNQGTLRQFCLCLHWTILFSIRFFERSSKINGARIRQKNPAVKPSFNCHHQFFYSLLTVINILTLAKMWILNVMNFL